MKFFVTISKRLLPGYLLFLEHVVPFFAHLINNKEHVMTPQGLYLTGNTRPTKESDNTYLQQDMVQIFGYLHFE